MKVRFPFGRLRLPNVACTRAADRSAALPYPSLRQENERRRLRHFARIAIAQNPRRLFACLFLLSRPPRFALIRPGRHAS
jgi:hypothetical protein